MAHSAQSPQVSQGAIEMILGFFELEGVPFEPFFWVILPPLLTIARCTHAEVLPEEIAPTA